MEPCVRQKGNGEIKRQRIVFHIDVNSAYLSWSAAERLKAGETLDLRTIPAIVGGNQESRHGIVLAKSIPAKAYGIYTSQPVAQAMRLCPGLTVVPPDHELYERYSHSMIDLLKEFTPDLEQISIDECFLDFTPIARLYPSPVEAAALIKDRIRSTLGFTVNIGIAPNKLLAKMASDFTKPDRVHTLWQEEVPEKMWPLSVRELYMVGSASSRKLESLGIRTIGELAATDPQILEGHFKSHGRQMWEYANGIDDTPVEAEQTELKGIGNSTTLREDARTEEEARRVLLSLSESVASRLRCAGKLAGTVTVEIKYHDFTSASHQCRLITPANTTQTVYEASCRLFRELWDGRPVRLLGIRTTHLSGLEEPVQLSLFDMDYPVKTERKAGCRQDPAAKKTMKRGSAPKSMAGTTVKTAAVPDEPAMKSFSEPGEPAGSLPLPKGKGEEDRQKKLDAALDAIRKKYGGNAVVRGSLLHDADLDSFGRKGMRDKRRK